MPTIYAKHHDKFIENYLSNFEEKALTSERLVMAKTKTNYVIPLYLNIKVKLFFPKDYSSFVLFSSTYPPS